MEPAVLARALGSKERRPTSSPSRCAAVQAALADPTLKDRLTQLGQVIFPADRQNPAALAAYEKAELAKWAPVIKAAGIKAQ